MKSLYKTEDGWCGQFRGSYFSWSPGRYYRWRGRIWRLDLLWEERLHRRKPMRKIMRWAEGSWRVPVPVYRAAQFTLCRLFRFHYECACPMRNMD